MEQLAPGSEHAAEKRTTGRPAIWLAVAAMTLGAASAPFASTGAKSARKTISAATARPAERSMIESVSLLMPGQAGQVSVCIHQTMPRTNHPYCSNATALLVRQAGEAVNEVMQASTLPPDWSALRTLSNSTRRTGNWVSCKSPWTRSHHLSGRSQSPQRGQYSARKMKQAPPTARFPTMLKSAMDWIKLDAASGSRRTTSTRWSSLRWPPAAKKKGPTTFVKLSQTR
mmetsp:Transcript_69099/g.202321  ORF Transcript_69099/g.202321 Transcript_69099/m.202321 type:complete len:228 (+) Transcript_69099:254-937(+)